MTKTPDKTVEMETFLPQENGHVPPSKYKIVPAKKSSEGQSPEEDEYDPFIHRQNMQHATTDCETLTHLLKAALGTGILAMPVAFKSAGLLVGFICIFIVGLICTHCCYILVKCSHMLYKQKQVSQMTFAEVVEEGCLLGPNWAHKFGKPLRYLIRILVFITYFGTCSVYTVIIAKNFQFVVTYYSNHEEIDVRLYIAALLIPLIILGFIPDYKRLAPVSMVANICLLVGLSITTYYLVIDLPPISSVRLVSPLKDWPQFFSITIFALECIGVVMPLENNMKSPTHFLGGFGVLNRGMIAIVLIYLAIGFLGFMKFGDDVQGSITLNLDGASVPAQLVQILIGIAVFCTYGLQFFVALEIVWDLIKHKFTKHPTLANYGLRTILIVLTVVIAVACPTIDPFMGLIGAFCFSLLGLLIPAFLELVLLWDKVRWYNWKIFKNIIIGIFSLFALFFGSAAALTKIAKLYE